MFDFLFTGCGNNTNNVVSHEAEQGKTAVFNIYYENLVSAIIEKGYSYEKVNQYDFDNEEANTIGVIYINPNDDLDIISTQIRHCNKKVFQVLITYTITDDSPLDTSEKLASLYDIVLSKIKPNVPKDFLRN